MHNTETMRCSRQKNVSFQWPAVTFSERAPTINAFLRKSKTSDDRHLQRIRHKHGQRSYHIRKKLWPVGKSATLPPPAPVNGEYSVPGGLTRRPDLVSTPVGERPRGARLAASIGVIGSTKAGLRRSMLTLSCLVP